MGNSITFSIFALKSRYSLLPWPKKKCFWWRGHGSYSGFRCPLSEFPHSISKCQLEFWLLFFWSRSLLMHLGNIQVLESLPHKWMTQWSSWLLVWVCPRPGYWFNHLRTELAHEIYLSQYLYLSFFVKIKNRHHL